jgi:tetratricopeptide (TPR) repeat protein
MLDNRDPNFLLCLIDFNTRSFYSVVTYLNDIPEGMGGGTKFYESDALSSLKAVASTANTYISEGKEGLVGDTIKAHRSSKWTADDSFHKTTCSPVAGRMLIFEQALAHEGVPPERPYYKYIIRSDVMYKRTPPICDSPEDREAYRIFKHAEQLAEAGKVEEAIPQFRKAIKMSPKLAAIMGH